ncbi:hypothetical protein K469DRAFT_689915 [Zopfia rhizophila CBS 207.26]|uniref:Uncharacterized protein n=1 Tax=Zopfia rhizophila CBS 207.26 TaxID=1314779 RepID=A0A6A6DZ27_9PEZI|nr:hypothetical protein K469DRAFT_689915 [Zopfia rhizophila CBS 207.26]
MQVKDIVREETGSAATRPLRTSRSQTLSPRMRKSFNKKMFVAATRGTAACSLQAELRDEETLRNLQQSHRIGEQSMPPFCSESDADTTSTDWSTAAEDLRFVKNSLGHGSVRAQAPDVPFRPASGQISSGNTGPALSLSMASCKAFFPFYGQSPIQQTGMGPAAQSPEDPGRRWMEKLRMSPFGAVSRQRRLRQHDPAAHSFITSLPTLYLTTVWRMQRKPRHPSRTCRNGSEDQKYCEPQIPPGFLNEIGMFLRQNPGILERSRNSFEN